MLHCYVIGEISFNSESENIFLTKKKKKKIIPFSYSYQFLSGQNTDKYNYQWKNRHRALRLWSFLTIFE